MNVNLIFSLSLLLLCVYLFYNERSTQLRLLELESRFARESELASEKAKQCQFELLQQQDLQQQLQRQLQEQQKQLGRHTNDDASSWLSSEVQLETTKKQLSIALEKLATSPFYRRRGRRLSYVIPFVERQIGTLLDLFSNVWRQHPPCNATLPVYRSEIDLVLYSSRVLGPNARDHQSITARFRDSLRTSRALECFASFRVLVANVSRLDPTERYGTKPVADQFFRLFEHRSIQMSADYLAYFEPDALPIRALWLERLYELIEFGDDFFMKGSIYRGDASPADFCFDQLLGCAEHINGNAIHNVKSADWRNFLRMIYRQMDMTWNYDTWIMHQLKSRDNWRFWQANAHRIQYTDFIMQRPDITVQEILRRHPNTFMAHQAKPT